MDTLDRLKDFAIHPFIGIFLQYAEEHNVFI